jgi:nucleoside-diphosphate-sugar epimerase
MKFTVLGSTGFIGRTLTAHLRAKGHEVDTPDRNTQSLAGKNLGHVIYAIGMTGNFREHPDLAIEAHVNVLQRLIKDADFESWLYLSSTRVYGMGDTLETTPVSVLPNADTLYDLSKLLGEAVCLSHKKPAVRVARISNVYGAGQSQHTFLGSILRDLKNGGKATIGEGKLSSKDYVSVNDVAELIELIALHGKERLYNIASGEATTHSALAEKIFTAGYSIDFAPEGKMRALPAINIGRIKQEFGRAPRSILDDIPTLLK